MATEAQLIGALRQADAAGDHAGAQRIAKMILAQRETTNPGYQRGAVAERQGLAGAIGGAVNTFNRAVPGLSELGAGVDTALRMGNAALTGQKDATWGDTWNDERQAQQGEIDQFAKDHPIVASQAQGLGFAAPVAAALGTGGTTAAPVAANGIRGIAARLGANAVKGAATAAVYGASQPGTLQQRVQTAAAAAPGGAVVGAAAPEVASVIGSGARAVRNAFGSRAPVASTSLAPVQQNAVRKFVALTDVDPSAMSTQAQRYQAAGIRPTLIDVAGDKGRGTIRAAATRATNGRQAVQDLADQRAVSLPDRISAQARANISTDPRTPAEIQGQIQDARDVQAKTDYDAVRDQPVTISAKTIAAIRTPAAQSALKSLASTEPDAARRGALTNLGGPTPAEINAANPATPELVDPTAPKPVYRMKAAPPPPQTTVGVLHALSEELNDRAAAAAAAPAGANDARKLYSLADTIRSEAVNQSPGYAQANANYAKASSLSDAADTGQQFLNRNTDDFVSTLNAFDPDQMAIAQAAARRAVERASGENVGAAPGVAKRIALAPEQQARNTALLGPDRAVQLQTNMGLEAQAVQNARDAAPRTGSQTALNQSDQADTVGNGILDAAGMVGRAKATGGLSVPLDGLRIWLKSRGLSDDELDSLSSMAVDPTKLQPVSDYISANAKPPVSISSLNPRANAFLPATMGYLQSQQQPNQ